MELPNLDQRLRSVADYVRDGACVADIGTDHAYLPVWLVLSGRVRTAIASDIVEGPVARAAANVARYGVGDRVKVIRADGLSGVKDSSVTDIVIAGMGGELIAAIISAADWVYKEGYRLILQPMTHPEILRRELLASGFFILDETLSRSSDGKKLYVTLCTEYKGGDLSRDWSEGELLLGKRNIERGGVIFGELVRRLVHQYEKIISAKKEAGADAFEEERILNFLRGME